MQSHLELSPLRKSTEQHISSLTSDYAATLGISEDALSPLLTRALTEQVGSEIYFKPNALPHLFRALQLEGKLAKDPDELESQLGNTWLVIFDISNLKKINEMAGSSHTMGDMAIALQANSVATSTDNLPDTSHCLLRFLGDEIADFINNAGSLTEQELTEKIDHATSQLVEQAKDDSNHMLHQLVSNPNTLPLLGKVMQFARLKDIQLAHHLNRADDMVEYMFKVAEDSSEQPIPSTTDKKALRTIKAWNLPISPPTSPTENVSAITQMIKLISAVDPNREHTPDALERISDRKQQILRFLPPTLQTTWEKAQSDNRNPQQLSHLLTIFEEALFNQQFSRNPPILNEWAFDELAKKNVSHLNRLIMVSPIFLKLYNTILGRIAATELLKHTANQILSELTKFYPKDSGDSSPQYLIKKQGGSFYLIMTPDLDTRLRDNLTLQQESTINIISHTDNISDFFAASKDLILFTPVSQVLRSDQHLGEVQDHLRSRHYHWGELKALARAFRHNPNQNLANLVLYYLSERFSSRQRSFDKDLISALQQALSIN